jgi:hypothetical protein
MVDPNGILAEKIVFQNNKKRFLTHLGYEDSVVNHLNLIVNIEEDNFSREDLDRFNGNRALTKRQFNVKTIDNLQSFNLNFKTIDYLKRDFRGSMRLFIKE